MRLVFRTQADGGGGAYLGVALCVLKQAEEELSRLYGPAALAHRVALVRSLRGASDGAIVAAERNAALEAQDVLEVPLRLGQLHLLDGEGSLACVLEVDTQI